MNYWYRFTPTTTPNSLMLTSKKTVHSGTVPFLNGKAPDHRSFKPASKGFTLQGDVRDAALMTFSVALFCVLGAQMYGIYMHLYFAAGLKPLSGHW